MMGIMGDIANGVPIDDAVNREALKYAVQREIFCSQSGNVLDCRTAVMVNASHNGVTKTMVFDPAWFDANEARLRSNAEKTGLTIEIIDGRTLAKTVRRGRTRKVAQS